MEKVYEYAAKAVLSRLEEQAIDDLEILLDVKKGMIGVIPGAHDHVENILEKHLGLPVNNSPSWPKASTLVFMNCGNHANTTLAADFVNRGGWLASSDWALDQIITAFPNMVKKLPRTSGDEVISVEAVTGGLWSHVTVPGVEPQWWLEGSSYFFEKLSDDVKSEAVSSETLQRYGSPYISVQFDWGKGRVLHVASHFYHQRSRNLTGRHKGSADEFLKLGMKLSDEAIAKLAVPQAIKFGEIQTAVTSVELITQYVIGALKAARVPA